MFTGLIKEVGKIVSVTPNNEGAELEIHCPHLISQIKTDDSVSVNGTCLTATKINDESFITQAVHVTLKKTNTGKLIQGSTVNLELALRATDHLGGHFVQGHVNTVESLQNINMRGKNWEFQFSLSSNYRRYFISEGSVAINGVSLTVATLADDSFTVSIIPHTYDNTTFQDLKIGDQVNIEVDVLAKYVENFMRFKEPSQKIDTLIKNLS